MAPPLPTSLPLDLLERYGHLVNGSPLPSSGSPIGQRFGESAYREALLELGERTATPTAVYVHVPFCHVRCLYCACETTITHSEERVDRYLDALEQEFDLITELTGRKRAISQLHVGGGTPNHLNETQLARLVEIVEQFFTIPSGICTSIECNPRRASAGQLDLLRGLGFRRVSFGVQDLNHDVQRAIGRVHSFNMVRDVYLTARETGFESINFDLVYGLPFQTRDSFQRTLDQIVELGPDRIACFGYTHNPGNWPHQHAIDSARLPAPAQKLALFQAAVRTFAEAGYRWIGLDVFARENDELTGALAEGRLHRNAIGYSATPALQVLAFGPSGIGEVCGRLVQNRTDLTAWQREVTAGRLPVAWGRRLTAEDFRRRQALLHLMCNLELPTSLAKGLDEAYARLCRGADEGLLEVSDDCIRVTPQGRYLLRGFCIDQDASLDWGSTQWRAQAGL